MCMAARKVNFRAGRYGDYAADAFSLPLVPSLKILGLY